MCEPLSCKQPGVCSPSDGQCVYEDAIDGTACDDGDRCSSGDRCLDASCVALRQADDSFSDFALWYGGVGGNRVAGLVANGDEVVTLVEFPLGEGREDATLNVGGATGGGGLSVTLPPGARHGLALVRHTHRGGVIRAELVAHSAKPLRGRGVHRMKNGLAILGDFTEEVSLLGEEYASNMPADVEVIFARPLGEGDTEPWFLENDSTQRVFDGFLPGDGTCAVVVMVQGGSSARLRRRGRVVAEFSTTEEHAVSAHIGVLPSCMDAVTIRRELRAEGGIVAVFDHLLEGDRLVLAGGTQGPFEVSSSAGDTELSSVPGPHAFLVSVTGGQPRLLAAVSDPRHGPEGIHFTTGSGLHGERSAFALNVVGQATVVVEGVGIPAADNPMSANDNYPRALAVSVDPEGRLELQASYFGEEKAPLFRRLVPCESRLHTFGRGNDGFTFSSFGKSKRLFSKDLCVPDEPGANTVAEGSETFAVPVEGTMGLFVAGTTVGECRLGSAKTLEVPRSEGSGFLLRVNSEDGIGCP